MRTLLTGAAGFIGFHLARRLLDDGHEVVGFDGFTDYYDPQLKGRRAAILETYPGFTMVTGMLEDASLVRDVVERSQPQHVLHLAAQAGVRYSLEAPDAYLGSNVTGTLALLEALRHNRPDHLLFASTSSVYGGNTQIPFHETATTAAPMSLYAATKVAGEAMTHSYAHLFDIPTTCFRFFTVYGPWGRPDMALFRFVERILRGDEIDVYGNGQMSRDFTYVEDLVEGVVRLIGVPPAVSTERGSTIPGDSLSPVAPWRVVNIAGGRPTPLGLFIEAIEDALGMEAKKRMLPAQPGEVLATQSDTTLLRALTDFGPETPVRAGVQAFVDWYRDYHR